MIRRQNILKRVGRILFIIFMFLCIYCFFFFNKNDTKVEEKKEIIDNFSEYVTTKINTDIYILDGEDYKKIGTISKNVYLTLEKADGNFFLITNLDDKYYIRNDSIVKTDKIENNDRYKKYIVFNKNVITDTKTSFYDNEGNELYSVDKGINLPIIYMNDDFLGIEVKDRLLYVKNDDFVKIIDKNNTEELNTEGIGVLNYHFFYDDNVEDDFSKCNQDICQSTTQLKEQLDYIKENGYFTPTMKEFEMYIDGKIQLPKSVVITIDDGWRALMATKIISDYKMNATVFVITGTYKASEFKNEYIEVHSHSDNMHNYGDCPVGQGGGIQCLAEEKILADLKVSSVKLGGSTVFCYPFYEYNNYAISMLKKAGYTMAFAGENKGSNNLSYVGIDKYKIPRFVMVNYTTINDLASYLKGNYYS